MEEQMSEISQFKTLAEVCLLTEQPVTMSADSIICLSQEISALETQLGVAIKGYDQFYDEFTPDVEEILAEIKRIGAIWIKNKH
jgi:hypothetical protein